MDLEYWQQNWDRLGQEDPFWAVLTDPEKRGGRWDEHVFFETGREEIGRVLDRLDKLGAAPKKGRVLDFGCGVGRLSQALASKFAEVHGIDISPSMIEHANRLNRHQTKCSFHLNSDAGLGLFQDNFFDFIYSNLVLQHIEPCYAKQYLREFGRLLTKDGVAVFQVLSPTVLRRLFPQFAVEWYRKVKHGNKAFIGMFGIPERKLRDLLKESHLRIIDLKRQRVGWRWVSLQFVVTKA